MSITLMSHESKLEMLNYARRFEKKLFLETKSYPTRKYWTLSTQGKLIMIAAHGLQPTIDFRAIPLSQMLAVGIDSEVFVVDIQPLEVLADIELEGVFYRYLDLAASRSLIVLHELGLLSINSNGGLNWQYNARDIVEGYLCEGNTVHLNIADGTHVSIETLSGIVTLALKAPKQTEFY